MQTSLDTAVMGKITSVYGVKGWVKVFSYAESKENICKYSKWSIERNGIQKSVGVLNCKPHGNGLVAQLEGCHDRDAAKSYCEYLITVPKETLPELGSGDYYWHQLEGLQVRALGGELLGAVSHLMETGSNDVLVVKRCEGSVDDRERLIPYLPEQVVKSVDLDNALVIVDWDIEF